MLRLFAAEEHAGRLALRLRCGKFAFKGSRTPLRHHCKPHRPHSLQIM